MFDKIKQLLGMEPPVDFAMLVKNGAQIIDVRTPSEFQDGHIQGAINIPLDTLSRQLTKIKKNKPVITCCASGMRSSSAKSLLKSNGFTEVYNGGGWQSLNHKIR
jgi:rhodanese-related sulfurtransferase